MGRSTTVQRCVSTGRNTHRRTYILATVAGRVPLGAGAAGAISRIDCPLHKRAGIVGCTRMPAGYPVVTVMKLLRQPLPDITTSRNSGEYRQLRCLV